MSYATGVVLAHILVERQSQDDKWGRQDHDNFTWNTILSEEVGEAAEAALDIEFKGGDRQRLREELIQVAAVATAWVECLDR